MASIEVLGVLAGFAAGMTAVSAVAVKWTAFTDSPLRAGVVLFLLLMMAGMLVGVLVYFAVGGVSGIVTGLWVSAAIMSGSVLLLFATFLPMLRTSDTAPATPPPLRGRALFVRSVVGLVIGNEFLMGWSFSLLSGGLPVGFGPHGRDALTILSGAVTSPWFVFPMAFEMILTLGWLWRAFSPGLLRYLLIQPAVMVCSPPTLAGTGWVVATAIGASALMGLAIAYFLVALFRDESTPRPVARYLGGLLASFGLMGVGLWVWVATGNTGLFALSLLGQMVVFQVAVTDPRQFSAESGGQMAAVQVGATTSTGRG